jgi:cytochrome oxidase assembly protein ShyY1
VLGILRQRRWIGFSLLAVVFLLAFVRLGFWQLSRMHERRASNAVEIANLAAAPLVWAEASPHLRTVGDPQQWQRLSVTGHWDDTRTLLWRSRVLDGQNGYEVVTPLVPDGGAPAVLVDRGWIPSGTTGDAPDTVPPAQSGTVTVVGYLQVSQPQRTSSQLAPNQILAINAQAISRSSGVPLLDGYLQLITEDPKPSAAPSLLPAPEIDDGPHLSYAIQWFLFASVAVVGWWVYVRREAEEQAAAGPSEPDRQVHPA